MQPPQATNKVERLNLLRCYVQRLCEDANQLGVPQAREEFAEVKLKHAQMLCVCVHVNRVYTKVEGNLKPFQATEKAEELH